MRNVTDLLPYPNRPGSEFRPQLFSSFCVFPYLIPHILSTICLFFFVLLKVFRNSAGITFESVSSFNSGKTIKESVCWTSLSGLSDVRLKRKLRAFTKTRNTGITRNTGTAQINGTQEHPGTPYITASVPGCSGVFWYSGVPGFSTFPS